MTLFDGKAEASGQPRGAAPTGVAELDHRAIRDRLSEHLDGSLPEAERNRVDEHLRSCPACRAFRSTLDATVRAVGELPREQAPSAAKRRLLDGASSIDPAAGD